MAIAAFAAIDLGTGAFRTHAWKEATAYARQVYDPALIQLQVLERRMRPLYPRSSDDPDWTEAQARQVREQFLPAVKEVASRLRAQRPVAEDLAKWHREVVLAHVDRVEVAVNALAAPRPSRDPDPRWGFSEIFSCVGALERDQKRPANIAAGHIGWFR